MSDASDVLARALNGDDNATDLLFSYLLIQLNDLPMPARTRINRKELKNLNEDTIAIVKSSFKKGEFNFTGETFKKILHNCNSVRSELCNKFDIILTYKRAKEMLNGEAVLFKKISKWINSEVLKIESHEDSNYDYKNDILGKSLEILLNKYRADEWPDTKEKVLTWWIRKLVKNVERNISKKPIYEDFREDMVSTDALKDIEFSVMKYDISRIINKIEDRKSRTILHMLYNGKSIHEIHDYYKKNGTYNKNTVDTWIYRARREMVQEFNKL